jgi:hypothetical protein
LDYSREFAERCYDGLDLVSAQLAPAGRGTDLGLRG